MEQMHQEAKRPKYEPSSICHYRFDLLTMEHAHHHMLQLVISQQPAALADIPTILGAPRSHTSRKMY